ncbi:uncharacterized protein LOC120705979 isoform X2 [Panicum virgatum]|uniref:uncharacterized protein LOC120705979 isoform X2 n=1 Tax=Panicum virgatum TaxID=38727 RepID=UPI0019D66ED6|nr:uncharacterized protein LOC120705979 isoform X2 [Panicum virgatum]
MATPEQRAVWGVRQRFRHAAVRRPVLLSCGPPLSWARLLAGGVGVCELPARRRRDEVPKAIEARVIQAPRRNSPQAVPRGVRTHACAAHSRRSGWPGRPVPSARAPRIRCRDKFLLLICIPLRADLCRCGFGFGDLGRGAPFAAVFLGLNSTVTGNLPTFDKQYSWFREATSHDHPLLLLLLLPAACAPGTCRGPCTGEETADGSGGSDGGAATSD